MMGTAPGNFDEKFTKATLRARQVAGKKGLSNALMAVPGGHEIGGPSRIGLTDCPT
jgi:hypothetical protein